MGKYVLKKTTDGQFMFNLLAANFQVILTSERYTTKTGAQNGIESVRRNSPIDAHYKRKASIRAEPYFVLTAANGEVIGTSEMYSSAPAMEGGIASVKANGPAAPVQDVAV